MVKISPVLNSQSKNFLLEFFYTWAVFENGDSMHIRHWYRSLSFKSSLTSESTLNGISPLKRLNHLNF